MQTNKENNTEKIQQSLNSKDKLLFDKQFPTPDNPPWNIWAGLGVWVASVVFIFVFQSLFLLAYVAIQRLNLADNHAFSEFLKTDLQTDPTILLLAIISTFPAHVCTLLLAWFVVTNFRKYSFRETLGWEWNGFKIWHSFIVVIVFFALALILTNIFGESDNEFRQMLKSSRMIIFPIAFLAVFTAPLVEEVVYRGILYSSLQKRLGIAWAVVAVTFLFALVHVPQYSKNLVPDIPTVTLLFLLSLTLTLIRVYTKNLLPCIVLHTIFNGVQSLLLIFEPYIQEQIKTEQPAFIFHLLK